MQKVLSSMRKAIEKYNLIENGDKIAIGISGGKDILVLLKALCDFRKFNLYNFEIFAVLIDIYSGEADYSKIQNFCNENNVELIIKQTDIKHIIFDIRKEKNPCSLCAKMRRGILCSTCNELGCNKLALGHHLQDVTTTFFMSLLYEGKLSTMLPKSYMSNSKVTVIRPLYLTEESKIISASKNMPILKSNCPANYDSKRKDTKELIENIQKKIPLSKKSIEHAILSPERYHLLDKTK